MKTFKQLKLEERLVAQQQEAIAELQTIARDIERCEKTVGSLKEDLEHINARHANRKTTQEDIHYLEDLLACAKRKLGWEKQLASVQKRTMALMTRVQELVNAPEAADKPELTQALAESLQKAHAAMERLQNARL